MSLHSAVIAEAPTHPPPRATDLAPTAPRAPSKKTAIDPLVYAHQNGRAFIFLALLASRRGGSAARFVCRTLIITIRSTPADASDTADSDSAFDRDGGGRGRRAARTDSAGDSSRPRRAGARLYPRASGNPACA